jgi:hypothetical protein
MDKPPDQSFKKSREIAEAPCTVIEPFGALLLCEILAVLFGDFVHKAGWVLQTFWWDRIIIV